jgi:hypothetical protein
MLGHLPLHDPSALLADCDVRSLRFRQPSDVVLRSSGKAKRTHWREKAEIWRSLAIYAVQGAPLTLASRERDEPTKTHPNRRDRVSFDSFAGVAENET